MMQVRETLTNGVSIDKVLFGPTISASPPSAVPNLSVYEGLQSGLAES